MDTTLVLEAKMRMYRQRMIDHYGRMRSDTRDEYAKHQQAYYDAMDKYIKQYMLWRKLRKR